MPQVNNKGIKLFSTNDLVIDESKERLVVKKTFDKEGKLTSIRTRRRSVKEETVDIDFEVLNNKK